MKNKLFFICVCFFSLQSFVIAQDKNWVKYILPGYEMLDTASGDLNLDGRKDILLVLKVTGEDKIKFSEEQRPLLILIQQADGSYYQAGRNDHVVLCKDCGGAFGNPYVGMKITNGFFSVEHYGGSNWRWTDIVTFKFDKKKNKWLLHKWGGDTFNTSEPEKKTTNIKTTKNFGMVEFENFRRE